jgi:hypothetical protein
MSRAATNYPTTADLRSMSVAVINRYLRSLRYRLSLYKSGPVHKALTKRLQVAEKVRELQRGREAAGDA